MTHAGPRTGTTLSAVTEAGRKAALIGYLPIGFPSVPGSIEAMVELVRSGVDIVEVGVPYSDPGMDGPVIQRAAEAALESGVRTKDVFTAVEAIASAGGTAVVMSYWNLVLQYGVTDFARDLDAAGGGGIITPDLIPDEAHDWLAASDRYDLDRIFLAAPSSTPERLARIVEGSRGFVYAASTMGVTGVRSEVDNHARELVSRLKEAGAVLDDSGQPFGCRRRCGEEDAVEVVLLRRSQPRSCLIGDEVGGDDAAASGGGEVAGEAVDAVLEHDVPVAHDDGGAAGGSDGFDRGEDVAGAHPVVQCRLTGTLDDGSVHSGIGVRHADLDDVDAIADEFDHGLDRSLHRGEADRKVADESGLAARLSDGVEGGSCAWAGVRHTCTAPSSM